MSDPTYDAIIVGGGPAGLSAALTLGRIDYRALVCDDNKPRNYPSEHMNNFPSQDGLHPQKWRELARKDLQKYSSIESYNGAVTGIKRASTGFAADLASGETVTARYVILAYGVKDRLLPIPGFQELWGKSIFHCPFCHGYEIKDQSIGFIMKSTMGLHTLHLLAHLAKDITVMTDGDLELNPDHLKTLERFNIALIRTPIERLQHHNDKLQSVDFQDGAKLGLNYLFYASAPPLIMKSQIGTELGCQKSELGFYQVNEFGETTVPGVFACGDNSSLAHSVLLACASGTKSAMSVIANLSH